MGAGEQSQRTKDRKRGPPSLPTTTVRPCPSFESEKEEVPGWSSGCEQLCYALHPLHDRQSAQDGELNPTGCEWEIFGGSMVKHARVTNDLIAPSPPSFWAARLVWPVCLALAHQSNPGSLRSTSDTPTSPSRKA